MFSNQNYALIAISFWSTNTGFSASKSSSEGRLYTPSLLAVVVMTELCPGSRGLKLQASVLPVQTSLAAKLVLKNLRNQKGM